MNFYKISSTICLTVSLILLITIFYKSEIILAGTNRSYYYSYYLISFSLIIFSILTYFVSKKIFKYLIICGSSFIFTLYFYEYYLIHNKKLNKKKVAIEQIEKFKKYKIKTGKNFDKRSKLGVYKDLIEKNNNITLVVPPSTNIGKNNKIFPLSGLSNSKTIFCNENGYYSIYNSDRYGFRNPDNEWDKKEINYLLIGDSYTHGACVNEPNDIASVIRSLSGGKSLINLGYSGNGPLIEYATLKEYLRFNTKNIIWIYFESNDLDNLRNEISDKTLKRYIENKTYNQNLKEKQKEIDRLIKNKIEFQVQKKKEKHQNEIKFNLIDFIKLKYFRSVFIKPKKLKDEFQEIVSLVKNLTIKNNSNLHFVYIPSYDRYKKKSYSNNDYDFVKKTLKERNINFIDIHKELFEKEENPFKFYPFGLQYHYNELGYRRIAEIIYNSVERKN